MKKYVSVITLLLLLQTAVKAQQIRGLVKDEKGNPVQAATAALLKAKDSSVVKLSLSKEGVYVFNAIDTGTYMIAISCVGYEERYLGAFVYHGATVKLPDMVLAQSFRKLKEVSISARKPVIEVKAGKTVMNVEGSINASGSDALELIRKSPGVMLDKDDNISLNGKSGVQVFIDNRPTVLSAQELGSYLKTIPSSQIEAIELINNPSAGYEASGSGGIINIRLKKNKALGFNATVNAGISASPRMRYDAGFSLNYRKKNLNLFSNYSYNKGNVRSDIHLFRVVADTLFDQYNRVSFRNNTHSFKAGADYSINRNNSIGVIVNGSFAAPDTRVSGVTPISKYSTGVMKTVLLADNISSQKNNNANINLNYLYKDSTGRSLTVNADYGFYSIRTNQLQPNFFLNPDDLSLSDAKAYNILTPTDINIYSAKADYEQGFAKGKLGIGAKTSFVQTDNDFTQYNLLPAGKELDRDKSNFFRYKENVNALYVQYSRQISKIQFQAGLRAEQTNVKGELQAYKKEGNEYSVLRTDFTRDYLDFFPSVSITAAVHKNHQLVLSYSRRIDRPVYKDLNPFEYRINEYTYHKGSIDLQPQYSDNISLTHSFKNKLNTSVSYTHVKNLFGQLVDTAAGLKGYLANRNIASQDIVNLNISYPFRYKNYSFFGNVNTYYSKYQSNYGAGRELNKEIVSVNVFVQNSIRFAKTWSAELSGFYNAPSIWMGSLKAEDMWSVDAGVQKQVMGGKGSIKFSVSDVFKSLKWSATSYFSGQYLAANGSQDSRQFKLSFTYRIGNNQLKAARQHSTGADDENKRAQNAGGLIN